MLIGSSGRLWDILRTFWCIRISFPHSYYCFAWRGKIQRQDASKTISSPISQRPTVALPPRPQNSSCVILLNCLQYHLAGRQCRCYYDGVWCEYLLSFMSIESWLIIGISSRCQIPTKLRDRFWTGSQGRGMIDDILFVSSLIAPNSTLSKPDLKHIQHSDHAYCTGRVW